jgi:hypothetical protein
LDPLIKPYSVSIATAMQLLGDMGKSTLYLYAAKNKLKLVKRGNKTEVVLATIDELNKQQLKPHRVGGHSLFGRESLGPKKKTGGRGHKRKVTVVTV